MSAATAIVFQICFFQKHSSTFFASCYPRPTQRAVDLVVRAAKKGGVLARRLVPFRELILPPSH